MMNLYPLLFKPVLKDYIWGGRKLAEFGKDLPDSGIVAESWEISSHEDGMSTVTNGVYAGKNLQDLLDDLGIALVGINNRWAFERGKFPLLVKLLDANDNLSVQVHPNDAYARVYEGNELGKTEMWVVLHAEEEAEIIYGLERAATQEELRIAISEGRLENFLHRVQIQAGDHICVPSGTLHSILGGAVMAEIQQNSNTTYRVYDWERLGKDGKPRHLHIDKALDVINYQQIGDDLSAPEIIEDHHEWRYERLCDNKYFTTERIITREKKLYSGECDGSTLEIWGVLSGEAMINDEHLKAVEFCLLPASLGSFEVNLTAGTIALRTYVQ
jgi:mannose-6-phosphate isomerase